VYLNGRAYWRNVLAAVRRYKLGGYQVLKKWLSYRKRTILARPPDTGGSAALYRYGPPHRCDPGADWHMRHSLLD